MTPEEAVSLRAPFPPEMIGQLPRAGITLAYVGHAAVTDRLLQVDPEWSWEPCALNENGTPLILIDGNNAVLWIRLTVCGMTRLGVGLVGASAFELQKQLISDAIRNAAMRFGVALDLWSKEGLTEAALPPAEPVASKQDVALFQACLEELADDHRSEFLAWKADQSFPWPWPQAALDAMEAKLEQIVGATSEATPDVGDGGEPGSDSDSPGSADTPASPPAAGSVDLPLDYLNEPEGADA